MDAPDSPLAAERARICETAATLFHRPISFEERAFQALEVVTKNGKSPVAVHVWARLEKLVPAIGSLYGELGISFENIARPWPSEPRPLYLPLYPENHFQGKLDCV